MGRTLKNILRTTLLGGGLLLFGSGCEGLGEAIILDSPIGTVWRAKEQAKQSVYDRQEYGTTETYDPWQGTAVVNRIQNPDGSIVFILDAEKIGEAIDTDYADRFLDETKYYKTWERNGIFGFIITYIPK